MLPACGELHPPVSPEALTRFDPTPGDTWEDIKSSSGVVESCGRATSASDSACLELHGTSRAQRPRRRYP
jgi:hypothetical protein